ncbi:MAG: histidine--tRNA ligase, partial [Nitrospinota bacterium]
DFWCEECWAHLGALKGMLERSGVSYTLNPRLVRGLDYYVRTAFEVVSEELGAQNAVCGGGRYDGLVAELGGPPTPAIGFAAGIERIVQLLQKGEGQKAEDPAQPQIFLTALSADAGELTFDLARELRGAGLRVERSYPAEVSAATTQGGQPSWKVKSLKSQMRQADRLGALFAVLIGEDEIASGRATVRNLRDSTQSSVPLEGLVAHLRQALQAGDSS